MLRQNVSKPQPCGAISISAIPCTIRSHTPCSSHPIVEVRFTLFVSDESHLTTHLKFVCTFVCGFARGVLGIMNRVEKWIPPWFMQRPRRRLWARERRGSLCRTHC